MSAYDDDADRLDEADDWMYEPQGFELRNDPPAHRPQRFDDNHTARQRPLIEGMDCLPGQLDLF